jgi:hypothetical protein
VGDIDLSSSMAGHAVEKFQKKNGWPRFVPYLLIKLIYIYLKADAEAGTSFSSIKKNN